MKNVSIRRQPKKRSRARTFDELETAFYNLVQKHNILSKEHRDLQTKHNKLVSIVGDIDVHTQRSYGL